VSSAEKLIHEAQHAVANVSPGSTDEKKYAARARRLANRILRKYPTGIEADQARMIIDNLDRVPRRTIRTPLPHKVHVPESPHTSHPVVRSPETMRKEIKRVAARTFTTSLDDDWASLLKKFAVLPGYKKKILYAIPILIFFMPAALFLFIGLAAYYMTNPPLLKKHLEALLEALA
jgi:hypothetical protein